MSDRILVREHLHGSSPESSEHVRYTWLTPLPQRRPLRVTLMTSFISLLILIGILPAV